MHQQHDAQTCSNCGTPIESGSFCSRCGRHIDFENDRGPFIGTLGDRAKIFLTTGHPRPLLIAILIGIIALLFGSDLSSLGQLRGRLLIIVTAITVVVISFWILDDD